MILVNAREKEQAVLFSPCALYNFIDENSCDKMEVIGLVILKKCFSEGL